MNSVAVCPVCEEVFSVRERPALLLPCLHSTCSPCISDIQADALLKNTKLRCRVCSETFIAEKVSSNAFINATTANNKSSVVPNHLFCNECLEPNVIASHRCSECHEYLCDVHVNAHRRSKKTHNHLLEQLASPTFTDIMVCGSHESKPVSAFCDQCQELVCVDCMVTAHQGHVCLSFADATIKHKSATVAQVAKLVMRIPSLNAAQEELATLKTALNARLISVMNEIDEAFNSLVHELHQRIRQIEERITQLEEQRHLLKKEAQAEIGSDIKTTEIQQEALELMKDHILTAERQTEAMNIDNPNLSMIETLSVHSMVTTRVRQLQDADLLIVPLAKDSVRFRFWCPADVMANAVGVNRLGAIGRDAASRDFKAISEPQRVVGTFGSHLGQFNGPIGIACLLNGNMVVADHNTRRLQIMTIEGTFLREVALPQHPYQIAVAPTGEIWIAVCDLNQLLCCSLDGTILRTVAAPKPVGIAVMPNGIVIVGCYNQNCVRAYTPEGVAVWTSMGDNLSFVYGVAGAQKGTVIIACDRNNHRLQILAAEDGHFIRHIGAGQLSGPTSVAVVPGSDWLVVTEQNRVSIWTMEGEMVHRWGMQGNRPGQFSNSWGGVCVLADGQIAVVEFENNRVQIF